MCRVSSDARLLCTVGIVLGISSLDMAPRLALSQFLLFWAGDEDEWEGCFCLQELGSCVLASCVRAGFGCVAEVCCPVVSAQRLLEENLRHLPAHFPRLDDGSSNIPLSCIPVSTCMALALRAEMCIHL